MHLRRRGDWVGSKTACARSGKSSGTASDGFVRNGVCAACPAGSRIVNGACECSIAGQSMRDGVCQCAPGHQLIDGVCGCPPAEFAPYTGRGFTSFSRCEICPEGQGVLSNGWCGACPGGTSFLVNGYCTAPDDPFQAPPVIKSAAPVVPELLAYDGANLGGALTLRWGAPLDSGRGGVLQYRARAQRSVAGVVNGSTYPGKCDALGENQWDAPEDYEYFDPNVFEKTYDSLANHACWRFFVSARNAAGWGVEAVTDPLLTRSPQGGSAVNCAADQARAWDGSADYAANHGCLNRLLLQGVDWCSRVSGGGEYYPNGYTTNAHPSWTTLDHHAGQICHFQEQTARCGPYRRKQIVDGDAFGITTDEDALCYVGEGPGCPDGEIYDFAHRECMCKGMGKRNERGACECPVAGASNECKCALGSVYHPDLNKCLTDAPWGEEFALTSPVAGTVAAADVGEVKLRVYQMKENKENDLPGFPDGGFFNVYVGDSRNPLTGSCRNAALEFKAAITLANATEVAGVEGTCRPGLPEGTHRLRAEYQLEGDERRNQAVSRLRAFALPAVSVTVGRTLESDCKNPNPAINPAGGVWDNEHMQCDISKEAFYNLSDPLSCTYGGAGGAECDDVFARMRQADCPAAGLVYAPNDYSCVCPYQGTPRDAGGCRTAADELLLTEVQKPSPNLATVRALLDQGADQDVATEDGDPVLFVAVMLGHAEVVSVLITAGANASLTVKVEDDLNAEGDFLPEYIAKNGLPVNGPKDEEPDFSSWRDVAEVMIHFGGGARVFSLTAGVSAYDWANTRGAHYPLNHLIHRYTLYNTFQLQGTQNRDNREAAAAMGGYLLDQGSPCPAETPEQVLFCALSRPQCPATGDSLYSCSVGCPGYSTRSAAGGACVSQCETDETTDFAAWPDARCRCAGGETPDEAGCLTTMDDDFLDALQADPPNLATIRFLLDQGVRPGITTSAGVPALFVAATLGRADVVSVLITAGANASAQIGNDFLPAYLVKNGLVGGSSAETQPWRDVAEVLIHFGGAINVVALTSSIVAYDWRDAHNADILRYLDNRYSPIPEQAAVMRVIGGYLLDQGAVCPADKVNRPICASRPACSAADSGKAYSCSICSGFPLRAVWGNKCVAACGDRQTEDANAWPDAQCMCPENVAADEFGCESDYDATLIQEVLKPSPNLATVRFLLDQGARPGIPGASSGVPLLFLAAYLRHPQVVSVLITAGAAPDVQFGVAAATVNVDGDPRPLPLLLAEQAHAGSVTVGQRLLDVFLHYGAAAGPEYNWREPLPSGAVLADEVLGVLALIANRETAGQVTILQQIGGYLRGLGGRCPTAPLFFQQTISASPVCTEPPVCQEGELLYAGVCLPVAVISTAESCVAAGWEVSADQGGTCGVPVTLFGGESSQRCHLSGTVEPRCSVVFDTFANANDFPAPVTTTLGATLHFVYNCDPRSESRLIPANANTVGATECACPVDGETLIDGVCRCPAGEGYHDGICNVCPVDHFVNPEDGVCTQSETVGEKCMAANYVFNDKGVCLVKYFNGFDDSPSLRDGCYTAATTERADKSGRDSCDEVFGPNFDFPPKPADLADQRFVFECQSPFTGQSRGVSGLIPAAANTVGATACACADNMVRVNGRTRTLAGIAGVTLTVRGVCVPPDQDVVAKVEKADNKCVNYKPSRAGTFRDLSVTDAGVSCVEFKYVDSKWTVFDRCYLSGSMSPQCSEVFGEDLDFPAAQLESPAVYNCDPDGTKNMIPATVNTIGATECACVDTDHEVLDGKCQSPPHADLITEVLKITTSVASKPILASIRSLLSDKADPNTTSAGIPLLARAVTLRNLELISVLIAAGADQNTEVDGQLIPEYVLRSTLRYSIKQNAEFLVFVGDAFHAVPGRSLNWPSEVFSAIRAHWHPSPGSPTLLAESEWLELQAVSGYLVGRGLDQQCTGSDIGHIVMMCHDSRRRCSAAEFPQYYSCGECANGNNILALEKRFVESDNGPRNEHSCTTSCGGFNVVLDEEAWPDPVCMCASGAELNAHNQCAGPLDGKLFDEVSKVNPPPVLSSVIALLDDGANPNIINDDGVHVLAVAATLLHAEVISVLVSAGADAAAYLPKAPPVPNLILSRLDGARSDAVEAMRVVEATRHFGDVADFDWRARTAANADLYVSLLSTAYESAANEEVTTAVKVAAEYIRDRGGQCEEYLGADHELCAPSRICPASFSGVHSCSECPELPLRPALAGGECVAACGPNEETDPGADWPDSGCRCKGGVPPDEFGCPSSDDDALIEEARKLSPVLASVIALLSLGARPDITTSAGVPILIVAATMLHADMVSVLITAGADPGATGAFPQFFAGDSVFVPGVAVALASVSSRDATEMLIHFGGALSVVATSAASFSAASFSWSGIDAASRYQALSVAYDGAAAADKVNMEAMAGYLQDQGLDCAEALGDEHPLCVARRSCSSAGSGKAYSCSVCSGFPLRSLEGDSCAAACEINQEADATTWPDAQCRCADGAADAFGCPSQHDRALIEEVQKPRPVLASVRHWLSLGARANVTTAAGTPLLVVAATLLHVNVVSLLIAEGADAAVRFGLVADTVNTSPDPRPLPLLLAEQAYAGNVAIDQRLADMFFYFGFVAGGVYDWREELSPPSSLADHIIGVLALAEGKASEEEISFLREIGGYLRGLDGECPDSPFYGADISEAKICTVTVFCPDRLGGLRGELCISREGSLEIYSDEDLCGAFGGDIETGGSGGDNVACSGVDANDTFCFLDSTEAFPCRGLFKHLQICNIQNNRKALNPFFCGRICGEGAQAIGGKCCPGDPGCPSAN